MEVFVLLKTIFPVVLLWQGWWRNDAMVALNIWQPAVLSSVPRVALQVVRERLVGAMAGLCIGRAVR